MNNSRVHHETNELNPFAFPSETDARFLLLIIAVATITLVLVDALITGVVSLDIVSSFLIAVTTTIFVFIWAWWLALKDATRKIRMGNLENFPPKGYNFQEDFSLNRLADYVEAIATKIPEIKNISPEFIWDSKDFSSTGMTFGFGKQKFVLLRQGLYNDFLKLPKKSKIFNAVLLHELGHLSNQDVSKTIFSIALGKVFFTTAIVVLGLFDLYVIFAIIEKLIEGRTLTSVWEGIPFIVQIHLKTCIFLILVEVIRSSISRVREYYADAYAKQCLGDSDSLIEFFSKENSNDKKKQNKIWHIVKQELRNICAPFHPTNRKRIAALKNNRQLFKLSYETAFFSGLLSGLVVNAISVISPAITEITTLILSNIDRVIQKSNNEIVLLLLFIVFTGIFLVYLLVIFLFIIAFALTPVVCTIGLQVQSAAYFDKLNDSKLEKKKLTSLSKILALSLVIGVSFVFGLLLVPTPQIFSFWRWEVSLISLISYILGWTSVFFLWMFPLKNLSTKVYMMHNGNDVPKWKRRWLTTFSAIALLPIFTAMSMVQILSFLASHPELLASHPELTAIDNSMKWSVILATSGLLLSALVWLISWGIFLKKGWFKKSRSGISRWAMMPSPILLPPLPPLQAEIDSEEDTPPLSF